MIPLSKLASAVFLTLSAAFIVGTATITIAQERQARPVARLITDSADGYTRPRRIADPATPAPLSKNESPTLTEANDVERRVFDLTNEARLRHGLHPLKWDAELARMARMHSENMARDNFFSHQTPKGERLKDRARAIGIARFKILAENIAFNQGFADPGALAVERWLISPGHRANILYREYDASAVGVFVSDNGAVYLTQAFIAR